MEGNGHNPEASLPASAPHARRRSPLPLIIVAALFIIVPFLTWYGTWFGRHLTDEEVGQYLADQQNTRHVQHALAQVEERMSKHDQSVKRWYPQIVALANSPESEIRKTVAWVMGRDGSSEEFHATLLRLLTDVEPIVRRNAAMALVNFNDGKGRNELRAMLQPFDVAAPVEGTLNSVLPSGSPVTVGALLARIRRGDGEIQELRSPVAGRIQSVSKREGEQVATAEKIFSIAPDTDSIENALVALAFVGESEDLPVVESFARGDGSTPVRIKKQAAVTADAIKRRSSASH
ncbi:MAG TPA: HEAT repeat domain-containing protein [Pyrinomonadaceae bacterium]|nr:HEAT repeat domain-containing protein [Pyrinomonadaceae bacterium]